MKLAACLIVRDSSGTIEDCLDHIRAFVDEINVYDTGSSDGTPEILEKLNRSRWIRLKDGQPEFPDAVYSSNEDEPKAPEGYSWIPLAPIRVERGEWRDDFSWAREQSFAMCSDDVTWMLWLDDDDEVRGAHSLRMLTATASAEVDGFVMKYDYARDPAGNCVCELWRERLIRREAGFEWRGEIHEVLVPPEGREPHLVMVPPEQVVYVHHRPEGRYEPSRNLKILEAAEQKAAAEGRTPDPRTLAYLGTENMAHGNLGKAVPYLQAYVEHPESAWSDERMQVMHKLASCLRLIGHVRASIEVEHSAIKERIDWSENAVGLAQGYAVLEEWKQVEFWAKRALELGQPQSMLILNPLEFTYIPLVLLAEAYRNLGQMDEALACMAKAVQVYPGPDSQSRLAEFEHQRNQAHLITSVLSLRETLVRFDENQKALDLMERGVPYLIADHPAIVKARADQRRMCRHLTHPDEYTSWYEDDPKESTVPDEWVPDAGDYIERARFTLELCEEFEEKHGRKPRVLDLGCNDAWMLGYLFVKGGYEGDGIELNKASVEKAQGRVERFGIPGRIVQGNIFDSVELLDGEHAYDVVSCFEVYEHVPDTDALLDVMESLLTAEGIACVTTPNGAFERGNIQNWQKVDYKGHLRAVPAGDLAEQLSARGEVVDFRVHAGDHLTFAAWKPAERKGSIVFYNGGSAETWSPLSLREGGIGGSETALVQTAQLLSERGYQVTVYAQCEPGLYGGALWKAHTAFDPSAECDLLVVSRIPYVFDNPIGARRTALWCHDNAYPDLNEARAEKIDEVIVLSDWQRDRYAELYPFLADKLRIIRNGISLTSRRTGKTLIDGSATFYERKPVCVYSSSADRGLDRLLAMWPRIRAEVPDAELHVYYGWNTFDRFIVQNPGLIAFKTEVLNRIAELGGEEGGIHMLGRVGQRDLSAAMREARVWTYPSYFLETSCIGAMEARAAGLPIVTSKLAALQETVGAHGILLGHLKRDGDRTELTKQYESAFVKQTVRLLADEAYWTEWHGKALDSIEECDWAARADEWEAVAGLVLAHG